MSDIARARVPVSFDQGQIAKDASTALKGGLATASQDAKATIGVQVDQSQVGTAVAQAQAAVQQGVVTAGPARLAETEAATAKLAQAAQVTENVGQTAVATSGRVQGLSTAVSLVGNEAGVAGGKLGQVASIMGSGSGGLSIVTGAVAGAIALAKFGDSLNDVNLSAQQLKDLAKLGSAGELLQATVGNFNLEDQAKSIQQLADGGAQGIGTLIRLREAYKDAGQDTSAFDDALRRAKESQGNLNDTVDLGKAVMDAWDPSAARAAARADALADAVQRATTRLEDMRKAQGELIGAELGRESSSLRVADAQARLVDAQKDVTSGSAEEQRAIADGINSATQALQKAQRAADEVAFAQQRAHLAASQSEAEITVKQAERARNRALTNDEILSTDKNLIAAQDDLAKSREAIANQPQKEADARQAVIDATNKLTEAQQKQVTQSGVLIDQQRNIAEATQGVVSAVVDQAEANAKLDDTHDRLSGKTVTTETHQRHFREELGRLVDEQNGPVHDSLGRLLEDYDKYTTVLDKATEATKRLNEETNKEADNGGILDRLGLNDLFDRANAPTIVAPFASGGNVRAGQRFRGGEAGIEILAHDGIYNAGSGGVVLSPTQTAKAFGGQESGLSLVQNNRFDGMPLDQQLELANRKLAWGLAS